MKNPGLLAAHHRVGSLEIIINHTVIRNLENIATDVYVFQ